MIGGAELEREARRVLRRMGRAVLIAQDKDCYAVARTASSAASSRVRVGGELVRAFFARGWICSDGAGRFARTDAGASFVAEAGVEPGGFKFEDRHRLIEERVTEAGKVRINRAESPLSRLAYRGLVDPVQFAAGEKMRRDFTLAGLQPRMGVDLTAPVVSGRRGGGAENISDIALAARQRVNSAMAALGSPLAGLAFDVCCHLMALEEAERSRGWSKRSGRTVLKIALDKLAAHYGLVLKAPARAKMRSWAAEAAE